MKIARVTGTVVSTIKYEKYVGMKLPRAPVQKVKIAYGDLDSLHRKYYKIVTNIEKRLNRKYNRDKA